MIYVTRREAFCAAHRLFDPSASDEENTRVYGSCNNPNGHGHNYVLEVTVAGEADPRTGYVIDLKVLSKIVRTEFIEKVDHKHLNLDVEMFRTIIPTSENIAKAAWKVIAPKLPAGKLYAIRLHETENNVVEYRGE
jgi:6-pyruvoyltetrahydropterin/6-carboxytetrahydropterin synthase